MSSYVCFSVKNEEKVNDESITITYYGKSSFLYDVIRENIAYSEEERELTDKIYNDILNAFKEKIESYEGNITVLDDCLKNAKIKEDILEFAEAKQEIAEELEVLTESLKFIIFFYNLDCKKYIYFD